MNVQHFPAFKSAALKPVRFARMFRESEMPPCRRLAKWLIARRFFGPAKPVVSRNLMWP
jgi:hypothetical protein